MPRESGFKFVISDRDRHGNVRWYYRRSGKPKVRLPGTPGSTEFRAMYDALERGAEIVKVEAKPKPARRARQPAAGYVYFLRVGSAVKIGFSTSPLSRIGGLKTAMAERIDAFVSIPGTRADEKALHVQFEQARKEGEWFKVTPALTRVMAQAAAYGRLGVVPLSEEILSHSEKAQ